MSDKDLIRRGDAQGICLEERGERQMYFDSAHDEGFYDGAQACFDAIAALPAVTDPQPSGLKSAATDLAKWCVENIPSDETMDKLLHALDGALSAAVPDPQTPAQCCMCGRVGLSTAEDGGPECELTDGRWVCSGECWDNASALAGTPVPQIATLQAVNARLVEALQWYGEQSRLARLIHSEGDPGRHALSDDGGKRARALLAELEAKA